MKEETILKNAISILEGLLVSPYTQMKTIEAMPIQEVEEQLRQMQLDSDQPLPATIRRLISDHRKNEQPFADNRRLTYTLLRKIVNRKSGAQPIKHESQITDQLQNLAGGEVKKPEQNIRNSPIRTRGFEDGDVIYRKGLDAFIKGHIEQAIEYWKEAKLIFLCVDLKREIAACDRNMGIAFQRLGKSQQAIQQFKRAKSVYLGIGLKEQVASCETQIATAYRELSGHSWR